MPEEMDLVKLNAILRYAKDVKHMRLASAAANELRIRVNTLLKTILTEATASAKKEKRSTIRPKDTQPATERILGGKNLAPQEVFAIIKKFTPIEKGQLSKLITEHIASEKAKPDS